jgi:hypothetical protein
MPRHKTYQHPRHKTYEHHRKHHGIQPGLPDKHITVRIVRVNPQNNVRIETTRTAAIVNDEHTVQQAVHRVYPLPGVCRGVSLRRGPDHTNITWLWSPERPGRLERNWYPTIQDGDIVDIEIWTDEWLDPPSPPAHSVESRYIWGPATAEQRPGAHTAGPHDQLCRCVPCSLAALLSLI